MGEIIDLKPWGVYQFPWGTAVRNEFTGKWTNIILNDGQEVDTTGMNVIIHENGIEFA